ncbi:MAG: ADP-ribosylglycohydrolase family protein [Cyclobacteriaceae bacterium]
MARRSNYFQVIILVLLLPLACKEDKTQIDPLDEKDKYPLEISKEVLFDKVLGMMVGSAIGDAMGAPTEMWSREAIDLEYGWVSGLDSMVREASPEGIWIPNLPAGGTTDDTRWKKLIYQYLAQEKRAELNASNFAQHILERYASYFEAYKTLDPMDIEKLEATNLKVFWLSEWVKVCRPMLDNDLMGYQAALGRFYGGEMVCAGLLYSPAIGVYFPGNPEKAYNEAFKLSLFDLGYAKDISALSAAMTAEAMKKDASPEGILNVLRTIDPQGYFQSRLVGRSSYRILQNALTIVNQAKGISEDSLKREEILVHPVEFDKTQMRKAFTLLDESLQDMPFHAGEIHLQVVTAMIFSGFDFEGTMQFLVNFGRDNDTTAAVAGAILGAYYGFEKLPGKMKTQSLKVNKNLLNTDMEALSEVLTDRIFDKYPPIKQANKY